MLVWAQESVHPYFPVNKVKDQPFILITCQCRGARLLPRHPTILVDRAKKVDKAWVLPIKISSNMRKRSKSLLRNLSELTN